MLCSTNAVTTERRTTGPTPPPPNKISPLNYSYSILYIILTRSTYAIFIVCLCYSNAPWLWSWTSYTVHTPKHVHSRLSFQKLNIANTKMVKWYEHIHFKILFEKIDPLHRCLPNVSTNCIYVTHVLIMWFRSISLEGTILIVCILHSDCYLCYTVKVLSLCVRSCRTFEKFRKTFSQIFCLCNYKHFMSLVWR